MTIIGQNYLFKWYQQLVAESLGKKGKWNLASYFKLCLKTIIVMMQLYLDGPKNNFFTFFYSKREKFS